MSGVIQVPDPIGTQVRLSNPPQSNAAAGVVTSLAAPAVIPTPLMGTIFVDPLNSTGLATPQGPGTATAPFNSWAALVQAWGTKSPVINSGLNVTFLSSSPANGVDPIDFRPVIEGQSIVQFTGTRGTPQRQQSGTFSALVAKSVVGAGNQLTVTLASNTGAIPGAFLQNVTRGSAAFLTTNTAGSTWTVTQPLALASPPLIGNSQPAEDNTWANGDTYVLFQQVALNIVHLEPLNVQLNGGVGVASTQLFCWALAAVDANPNGIDPCFVPAGTVSWYECNITMQLTEYPPGPAPGLPVNAVRNTLYNCDLAPFSCQLGYPTVWAGQYRSPTNHAPGLFGAARIDNDFVMVDSVTLQTGASFGQVFLGAGTVLRILTGPVQAAIASPVLYGTGGLNVQGSSRFIAGTGNTFVAQFQFTGALQINGQGNALNGGPGAIPAASAALTPANLDGATFTGNAWVPGGGCITKGNT